LEEEELIWFTEYQTENVALQIRAKEVKRIKSKYQEIIVLDSYEFGKVLVLDGLIQTTEKDEFVYHEMLAHPAMLLHPEPKNVLVIGGGDGGTIREILKHPSVEQAHLCEIDEEVIIISEKYFPSISSELRNPKVKIFIEDGNSFLDEKENHYDVIILDSSDPVGASEILFQEDFYKKVKKALKKDGIMAAQTESPILQEEHFRNAVSNIKKVFRNVGVYLAFIPTYPSGMWSFTVASDLIDVKSKKIEGDRLNKLKTNYFSDKLSYCLFSLPKFVEKLI
jgi:spermidine synthase